MKVFCSFLAFLAIVITLAASCKPADAYTLMGFKLDHLNVTYSCGNEELANAVREWAKYSALTDGGCTDTNPDIALHIVPDSEIPNPIQGAGGMGGMWIPIRNEHNYGVILHETGHAIGIGHSSENLGETNPLYRTAAMYAYCCNPLNDDDKSAVVALYGPEPTTWYKYRIPVLARD